VVELPDSRRVVGADDRAHPATGGVDARLVDAYRAHYERLVGMCFRRLRDLGAAEDAAHDAFVRALAAGEQVTDHAGWLYTVAANICTDELRRRARRRTTSADLGPLSWGAPDERALSAILLGELFKRLPRQEREVLAARVQEDLSYTAIARRMCISENAVGAALHRARKHVAALLDESAA